MIATSNCTRLARNWTKTYVVTKVYDRGALELEDFTDGNRFKVNVHRVKHYYEGMKYEFGRI